MSLEAWTIRMTPSQRNVSKRTSTSLCRPRHGATRTSWQSCERKWRGISAPMCQSRIRSEGGAANGRRAEISIVTVNANFWTTRREWTAHVGPRHLVLGQEHRLEAGRCDEEARKLEREGWRCGFAPRKAQRCEVKVRVFDGHDGGHLRGGAQALGAGVGVACA